MWDLVTVYKKRRIIMHISQYVLFFHAFLMECKPWLWQHYHLVIKFKLWLLLFPSRAPNPLFIFLWLNTSSFCAVSIEDTFFFFPKYLSSLSKTFWIQACLPLSYTNVINLFNSAIQTVSKNFSSSQSSAKCKFLHLRECHWYFTVSVVSR